MSEFVLSTVDILYSFKMLLLTSHPALPAPIIRWLLSAASTLISFLINYQLRQSAIKDFCSEKVYLLIVLFRKQLLQKEFGFSSHPTPKFSFGSNNSIQILAFETHPTLHTLGISNNPPWGGCEQHIVCQLIMGQWDL